MSDQKKVWACPEVSVFGSVEMHTGGRGRHGRHGGRFPHPGYPGKHDEYEDSDCVRPLEHVFGGPKKR